MYANFGIIKIVSAVLVASSAKCLSVDSLFYKNKMSEFSSSDLINTPFTVTPSNAMAFFKIVGQLKTLKRTGWVNNNVALPESVADHMYRMSMMSFLISDQAISKERLMKICLVHDLAESIVGDITPHQNISKDEKRKLEEDALRKIISDISHPEIAQEILNLWLDYEEGTTKEAQIAKQLDKLEMIIQADEYEVSQGKQLDDFFHSTRDSFSHPEVVGWAEYLRAQRQQRIDASKGAHSET